MDALTILVLGLSVTTLLTTINIYLVDNKVKGIQKYLEEENVKAEDDKKMLELCRELEAFYEKTFKEEK